MSVAGDGDNAGDSGASAPVAGPLPPAAGPRARHRVPPTATAAARVLPEPFTPPKPTIPAIPHQRRPDGPTAIATAAIPAAPSASEEADPSTVATLAGEARADAADLGDVQNVEFIVSLPGLSNEPAPTGDPSAEADPSVETVEGELVTAEPLMAADDSPTVADYEAPALAIVTDYAHEDADDYRGSRRRVMPWRRYPVGAVAVAVLLLLVTGAVVFSTVRSDSAAGSHDGGLPAKVPSVDLPGTGQPQAAATPSEDAATSLPTEAAADPATTRPRATTTGGAATTAPATTAAAPTKAQTTAAAPPPPPPPAPTQGRLISSQSRKCVEYRSGSANRIVIDNCDTQTNQVWKIKGDPAKGATLVADNGYCLDVPNAGKDNGTILQVYSCNGTVAQVWVRRADNTWQNPNSKKCVTAAGSGAGSYVVIYDCVGASVQVWTMQ
ncbi:ricin-type beta-trefoil lectin domain protein [Dactylosporangium sp. CS-033363]|uniref:RICIN domain-containing protein n=1 Tax=Dactylosporangium sp. CS-033363 TaxID=3239935 RepID=UPI003D9179C3